MSFQGSLSGNKAKWEKKQKEMKKKDRILLQEIKQSMGIFRICPTLVL